VILDTQTDKR